MSSLFKGFQAVFSVILALFLVFALRELVIGTKKARAAMLAALCGGILFVQYRNYIPQIGG